MRDAARHDIVLCGQVRETVRRCVSFDRRIGRDNQFLHILFAQPFLQKLKPQFLRTDSIQWRQMPHQDKVLAPKSGCVLNGHDIRRRFNHANLRSVTAACRTNIA